MFAGSIQDRLRARDDKLSGYRGYPVNVSGHVEKVKNYSHSCHHIVELKEKQRRLEALEEQLRVSEQAKLQMMTDMDRLKDKLQESELIQKRDAAIIESQKHAIAQLQLALGTQQKAVESIFNDAAPRMERELKAAEAKVREALTPRGIPAPSAPAPAGLVSFGGSRPSRPSSSGESESEVSLAPPTAKLYTPGTTPRTDISSPRSPSPVGFL
ncbi:unnamed protein product [Cladocopium goreaui]|uniref:Lipase n=1 Tax=Cladocopium goreaui TaxID=2562237 RepID=A0A9P1GJ66_9DINO|nr:unnamed protein product [Cladocopium goreaui]